MIHACTASTTNGVEPFLTDCAAMFKANRTFIPITNWAVSEIDVTPDGTDASPVLEHKARLTSRIINAFAVG